MNPQLLHIFGPFWITSYGVFVALGIGAFLAAAFYHKGRRHYISDEQFFDGAASGIAGGLLGGKLLFLVQSATSVASIADVLGGFAILGAIIGGSVGIIGYLLWQELPVLEIIDIAGAYALLAHGIARWGCFFAGCCYGRVCSLSWLSVVYTNSESLAPLNLPLYPVQIGMSIASIAGFFLLRYVVYPWRGRPLGAVAAWYILYESSARFALDFWRGDRRSVVTPVTLSWWSFSFYQYVAVLVVLSAAAAVVGLHLYARRRR